MKEEIKEEIIEYDLDIESDLCIERNNIGIKTETISECEYTERNGWHCYPIDDNDPKLHQKTLVVLDKLRTAFDNMSFQDCNRDSRRRVSYNQLQILWKFLNEHRDIATGFNKTTQAREDSRRMWESVANILNSQGDGARKDWKSWNKYWNDFKCKLKNKVTSIRASQRTGGEPSWEGQLSELDLKFLEILGDDFGTGRPEARVEPFVEPLLESLASSAASSESLTPNFAEPIAPQEDLQKSSVDQSPSPVPPSPIASPTVPTPPRRRRIGPWSRSRHRRRQEMPLTMDSARRTLVRISEERALDERRRTVILEAILQELREIKQMFRSRLVLPSDGSAQQ